MNRKLVAITGALLGASYNMINVRPEVLLLPDINVQVSRGYN